jgi:hypothetical protein
MAPLPAGEVHSDDEELEWVEDVAFFSGSDSDFDYEDGLEPLELFEEGSEPEEGPLPDGVVLPEDLYD